MTIDPEAIPQSPSEMTTLLLQFGIARAYGDITTAARRGRLTEHDIANIERGVIDLFRNSDDFAHEFPTFEVEPAVVKARELLKSFFVMVRNTRAQDIEKK